MSQITKLDSSGSVIPPEVPLQFTTDDGIAIPAISNLNVNAVDSTENNANGILAKANPNLSDNLEIILTNRATGTITTTDATPTIALTFSLANAGATGVYFISGDVVAFDVTDSAGGSYSFVSGAKTIAGVGTEIGTEFKDELEDAAMAAADFNVSVSGNNFIVTVIGILGKTINWNVSISYRFVA